MGNKMIDVNEKYVFKVRECCLPLETCQFRCEDLTCALEEDCVVIKKIKEQNTKQEKIERLKREIKKLEYNIEDNDKHIKKELNLYFGVQKMWRKKIKQKEQELKELEDEKE